MSAKSQRIHLALTGDTAFWPADRTVWLASPSCVPKPWLDESELSKRVAGTLPYPWASGELAGVHARLAALHERQLCRIGEALNRLHGVSHGLAYWRLVVGPWLYYFINLLAHHAASLQLAQQRFHSFEVHGLDDRHFVTPATISDFLYESTDDLYNLQVCTRLCRLLGIPLASSHGVASEDRLATRENPEDMPVRRPSVGQRLRARSAYELRRLAQRLLAPMIEVVCRRSYLPAAFEQRLILAARGRIWCHEGSWFDVQRGGPVDGSLRERLRTRPEQGGDVVEDYLAMHLADELPRVFVEEYSKLCDFAATAYSRYEPDVVMSTVSWHTDHAFCDFAGRRAEAGALLIGGQHGGLAGIEADSQIEDYERSLTDWYLTWGWQDPADPRCIPTPATRLVEVRERPRDTQVKGILYMGTVAVRYPVIARADFSGYFALQRRFFAAAGPGIRAACEVRLHASDFGWGVSRRLRAAFPDLRLQGWGTGFSEALARCRLYVCDHLSTTFTEAIASNTPTVLFWDPVYIGIRPSAQPVFDRARAAGFVQDSPEAAAAFIGRIWPDVEGWWYAPETQTAVAAFRDQFARTSPEPLVEWLALFERARQQGRATVAADA